MNWRKWIRPGLAITVVATPLAVFFGKGGIERDLTGRVTAALAASGQTWATVSASAQDVRISGIAPAADSQAMALRAAQAVPGVTTVSDGSTLLPIASPYVWSVRLSGRQITLSGSVPSDGARAALLAAARRAMPQAEIVDRMSLARGSPAVFSAAAAFALTRLPSLSDGAITLSDATLSVSGTAVDGPSYDGFGSALAKDVPAAVELGSINVLPTRVDRYVWSVNLDTASVTLAGDIPNQVVRDTLNAAIKANEPGLPLVDGLTIASGDPPGFAQAASFAISALQHLQRGGVTLDGLTLDIAGQAKSVDDYDALQQLLQSGAPEGVKVVSADILPAVVATYGWQGDVANGKVTLSGYVPTPESRADLDSFAKATLPGLTVEDDVRVAAGGPRMDWVGAVKFAIGQLALLGTGNATISANGYAVSGEARDAKSYSTALDQTSRPLPSGLALKSADVEPPRASPYGFTAERRDGRIVLTGDVSDDADRQLLLNAAQRVAGTGTVSDNLTFASGAPASFAAAAIAAERALIRLAGGRVDIVDQAVTITGAAFDDSAVSDIEDDFRDALPAGFTVVATNVVAVQPGQPMTAAACRDQLQAVMKAGGIEFDANNPVVTTDSLGTLDRIAGTMLRCPAANVEVGVYSDNDGNAQTLHDRTQARADAIVDYLAGAGVQRERLTGVGYGSTKPIADNSTPDGRAANRRVELTVAVPAGG